MSAPFYCSESRPPTFSNLTRNWRSRTLAICLTIRCIPATFRRVNCQSLCSWGMLWPQGHSWRTAKHYRWGCWEDRQLFYVNHTTLGLLCHPAAKIIYNLAISYSKSKQCKNHKITISSVISAQNFYLSSNDRHSSHSDWSSFNIETENITSNLNLNNSVKMDLYCNSLKKYMDCMK